MNVVAWCCPSSALRAPSPRGKAGRREGRISAKGSSADRLLPSHPRHPPPRLRDRAQAINRSTFPPQRSAIALAPPPPSQSYPRFPRLCYYHLVPLHEGALRRRSECGSGADGPGINPVTYWNSWRAARPRSETGEPEGRRKGTSKTSPTRGCPRKIRSSGVALGHRT